MMTTILVEERWVGVLGCFKFHENFHIRKKKQSVLPTETSICFFRNFFKKRLNHQRLATLRKSF